MSEIKLNQEIISTLQKCNNIKEIMALAKENGIELNEGQAGNLFAALQNDKLTDEELENVAGGHGECPGVLGLCPPVCPPNYHPTIS